MPSTQRAEWRECAEQLACGCWVLRSDGVSRMRRSGQDATLLGDKFGYNSGGWPLSSKKPAPGKAPGKPTATSTTASDVSGGVGGAGTGGGGAAAGAFGATAGASSVGGSARKLETPSSSFTSKRPPVYWEFDYNSIIHSMHSRGINMRHAGKVFEGLTCVMWQRRFLLEMVARAVKADFRKSSRELLYRVDVGTRFDSHAPMPPCPHANMPLFPCPTCPSPNPPPPSSSPPPLSTTAFLQ
jgi:hypothetical protein